MKKEKTLMDYGTSNVACLHLYPVLMCRVLCRYIHHIKIMQHLIISLMPKYKAPGKAYMWVRMHAKYVAEVVILEQLVKCSAASDFCCRACCTPVSIAYLFFPFFHSGLCLMSCNISSEACWDQYIFFSFFGCTQYIYIVYIKVLAHRVCNFLAVTKTWTCWLVLVLFVSKLSRTSSRHTGWGSKYNPCIPWL